MKNIKSKLFRFANLFLALLILLAPVVLMRSGAETTIEEDKNKYQKLESQLTSIKQSQAYNQDKLAKAQQNKLSALETKELYDDNINLLQQEIDTISQLVVEYNGLIEKRKEEISALTEEMRQSYNVYRERLITIYETGSEELIDFVLSSADFSDFLSRVELTNDFLEYDKKLIQKLADDKTLLENKKAEREVAVQRCNEILKQSENKKIELDQKISDVNTLINNLKYQEEYYKQLADQDAQEAKDLKDLMTLLQKQIDEKAKYEGDMRWPLQIVSDGSNYITSNYGYRTHPVTGETESFHNGIDIGTNGASPPVYAANSGKVIYAAPKGTYGNCVIIDHGSGISTLYAHLSVIKVKSGTTVKKGDLIGYVGSTGRSTGNHLHFTVMLNGSPVFPGDYVKIPYKYPVK